MGSGENRYIGGVAEKYDYPLNLEQDKARTYEIYAGVVADKLEPLNGVLDFIELCKKEGIEILDMFCLPGKGHIDKLLMSLHVCNLGGAKIVARITKAK